MRRHRPEGGILADAVGGGDGAWRSRHVRSMAETMSAETLAPAIATDKRIFIADKRNLLHVKHHGHRPGLHLPRSGRERQLHRCCRTAAPDADGGERTDPRPGRAARPAPVRAQQGRRAPDARRASASPAMPLPWCRSGSGPATRWALPPGRRDGPASAASSASGIPCWRTGLVRMHRERLGDRASGPRSTPRRACSTVCRRARLDLAVLYNPPQRQDPVAELLVEEKLVLVTSDPGGALLPEHYVHVDWARLSPPITRPPFPSW